VAVTSTLAFSLDRQLVLGHYHAYLGYLLVRLLLHLHGIWRCGGFIATECGVD
jgi:hypothetical protein